MLIFILIFWLHGCFSYHTTITSNYTDPPIPPPPVIPTRPISILQTQLITIFSPQKLMGFVEYVRIVSITFKRSFASAPDVLLGIQGMVDNQVKRGINIQLTSVCTISQLNVTYIDYSGPASWTIGKLLKVRSLAFDSSAFTNMALFYSDHTLFDSPLVVNSNIRASWIGLNVHILPFIARMIFSVAPTIPYYILTELTYAKPATSTLTIKIKAEFPTFMNVSKQIGFYFLFYCENTSWIAIIDSFTVSKLQMSTQLTNGLYYFVGLSQYAIFNDNAFDFQFNSDSTIFDLRSTWGANYVVEYNYLVINDTQYYSPKYVPPIPSPRPQTAYNLNIASIKSFSNLNTSFQFIYQNLTLPGPIDKSQIQISLPAIVVEQVYIINNSLVVLCRFNEQLENKSTTVVLTWLVGNIEFIATTSVVLSASPPLKVYSMIKNGKIIGKMCQIIQYFYLAGFLVALLSQKLVGLQLITFIQFIYYGQIPLNLKDIMIEGFKKMSYVSGFNLPLSDVLVNRSIPYCYSSLNLYYNFLSNINIMLIPIVIAPIISVILLLGCRCSKSYTLKPRLKRASMFFLFQIIFAFVLFNAYNINISLVISFSNLENISIPILLFAVSCSLLQICLGIIYLCFSEKYLQFKQNLTNSIRIKFLSEENSQKAAKIYPSVLILEILITPFLLSQLKIFSYSFYTLLCFNVIISIYVSVSRPYTQKLNNIRLFVHRGLMLLGIINFIIIKQTIDDNTDLDSSFFNLAWIFIGLLFFDWMINFPYIIWKTFQKTKMSKINNLRPLLKQSGDIVPDQIKNDMVDPVYYPILEYGRGRERREKQKKEKQREKERVKIQKQEHQKRILNQQRAQQQENHKQAQQKHQQRQKNQNSNILDQEANETGFQQQLLQISADIRKKQSNH